MIPNVKRLWAAMDWWGSGKLNIGCAQMSPGGTFAPVVTWEAHQEGRVIQPMLTLEKEEAQQLMDGLYAAGVRPTDGQRNAEAFAAQGAHLKDLQRLVFEMRPESLEAVRRIALANVGLNDGGGR